MQLEQNAKVEAAARRSARSTLLSTMDFSKRGGGGGDGGSSGGGGSGAISVVATPLGADASSILRDGSFAVHHGDLTTTVSERGSGLADVGAAGLEDTHLLETGTAPSQATGAGGRSLRSGAFGGRSTGFGAAPLSRAAGSGGGDAGVGDDDEDDDDGLAGLVRRDPDGGDDEEGEGGDGDGGGGGGGGDDAPDPEDQQRGSVPGGGGVKLRRFR